MRWLMEWPRKQRSRVLQLSLYQQVISLSLGLFSTAQQINLCSIGSPSSIITCIRTAFSLITRRMRAAAGTKPGEAVEPQVWCEGWTLPGAFWIDQEEPALETARNWRAEGTIWTDGSQLDSGGWGGMYGPPGNTG